MPAPLSLIQSIFKKYLLSAYYMLGSVNKTLSKKKENFIFKKSVLLKLIPFRVPCLKRNGSLELRV